MLAVLPFVLGDGGERASYLSDGLADAVAQRIGVTITELEILGRRAQRRTPTNDPATLRGIGAELETRYLVSGVVTGERDGVRVSINLFDVKAGKRAWERTFLYDSLGGQAIVQIAATEVASRVAGRLPPAQSERLARIPTRNRAAYDWVLRGDAARDGAANDRAAEAYRQAIRQDRTFADAWAKLALADAGLVDEGIERDNGVSLIKELRGAATRAVTADPNLPLAWLAEARARVLEGRSTTAWRIAFDRATALDGRDPTILEQYGLALAQTEDRTSAREMLRRAAARAPRRAEISTALAELAMTDRADGDACVLLNRAIADDALYGPAWAMRALVRARHADLRFAWADAETAIQVGSPLLGQSAAAMVDLKARDTVHARSRLGDVWLDVQARGTISVREGRAVATTLIAAGQMPRALDVLETVRPRGPLYAATLRDPNFDQARREPRFRALVVPRQDSPPEARLQVDRSSEPWGLEWPRGFVARGEP